MDWLHDRNAVQVYSSPPGLAIFKRKLRTLSAPIYLHVVAVALLGYAEAARLDIKHSFTSHIFPQIQFTTAAAPAVPA
jgi:hypothetical protein